MMRVSISGPSVDRSDIVSYRTVAEARISGGRILFRGDGRAPEEIFQQGIKPKQAPGDILNDNTSVIPKAYVSKTGLILGLTPYLNTAAIFPINNRENRSYTWVYMTKPDHGLPIAPHSLLLAAKGKYGAASYPAEVITHLIPPKSVICAIRIKRNWETGSCPAMGPPSGDFTIEEIRMNPRCTVGLDDVPLREYLEYLRSLQARQTKLPFALSESHEIAKTSINEDRGLLELAPDLIAQNSPELPAQVIQKWLQLLSNMKQKALQEPIENTINEYPEVLRIISPGELFYLLSSYPVINDSILFSALKKTNQAGLSVLSSILKNKPEGYQTSDALKNILIYFAMRDINNRFIEDISAVLSHIESLAPDAMFAVMGTSNPSYKTLFNTVLLRKLRADNYCLPDYQADIAYKTVIQLIGNDPDSADFFRDSIEGLVKVQLPNSESSIDEFGLRICEMALEFNETKYIAFYKILLESIEKQSKTIRFKISNPQRYIDGRSRRVVSPIISAVKADNIELVKTWIAAGASLRNERSLAQKNTPLMTAIIRNLPAIALFILSQGSYASGLDLKNIDGMSVSDLINSKANTPDWDIVKQKLRDMESEKAGTQKVIKFEQEDESAQDLTKPMKLTFKD